jgi:hypothetical protein
MNNCVRIVGIVAPNSNSGERVLLPYCMQPEPKTQNGHMRSRLARQPLPNLSANADAITSPSVRRTAAPVTIRGLGPPPPPCMCRVGIERPRAPPFLGGSTPGSSRLPTPHSLDPTTSNPSVRRAQVTIQRCTRSITKPSDTRWHRTARRPTRAAASRTRRRASAVAAANRTRGLISARQVKQMTHSEQGIEMIKRGAAMALVHLEEIMSTAHWLDWITVVSKDRVP